jgi:hypothetical protein
MQGSRNGFAPLQRGAPDEEVIQRLQMANGHRRMACIKASGSGFSESGENHQINVTTGRMAPFPEFFCQSLLFLDERPILKILQPMVHKIKGVIDQLCGLFGGHDAGGGGRYQQ